MSKGVVFATKNLSIAKKYIEKSNWQALKDNEKRILKEVEKGLMRIGDPMIYGEAKIVTGDNWYDEHTEGEFLDYVYGLFLKESP